VTLDAETRWRTHLRLHCCFSSGGGILKGVICRLAAIAILIIATVTGVLLAQSNKFVSVRGHKLYHSGKPYYFVGTNYWYGGLLGLEKDKRRGIDRLRRELDFLKANGVTNLRLTAGAEGSGPMNGVTRVGPPLQPDQAKFDASVLDGLDLVLHEMSKRQMKAVIFFSNNWEWSGGFQQYLIWNGVIDSKWLTAKPTWDELRDITAKFYSCEPCMAAYRKQVAFVMARVNKYNKRKYTDDPTIMTWEIANEPRPMRATANDDYARFVADTAAGIKAQDRGHLVTIGHEGWVGTESNAIFKRIHEDPNVDYLTIHVWPKNWGWFRPGKMKEDYSTVQEKTRAYLAIHIADAAMLNKPLVIEEFGLPRDGQSFDPAANTRLRDQYFRFILSYIKRSPHVAGANFWAFGGKARPRKGQMFWKPGDEFLGDPPMEEQGLNTVFDSDASTWRVIRKGVSEIARVRPAIVRRHSRPAPLHLAEHAARRRQISQRPAQPLLR
jgi:mannan endo-1,4-beta-mannosidase